MYRKIPKSTARGICRSRSPITMERPGEEEEKQLSPGLHPRWTWGLSRTGRGKR